jgi:ComF family protein
MHDLLNEVNLKEVAKIYIGYEYSDKLKKMIHLFKYERYLSLASIFASSIADSIKEQGNFDLIIPVPLHHKKEYERGYNQSEEIAKQLSKITNIEYSTKIIQRKKYTISQTTLNKNERILNVSNAFTCSDNIRNKTVLIIDDVITTGSTLKACAQCILKNGAKSVSLAAVTTPPFAV